MKYDRIIIRYGEISTKGKNRNLFIDKLRKSIKPLLRNTPKAKIESSTRSNVHFIKRGKQ